MQFKIKLRVLCSLFSIASAVCLPSVANADGGILTISNKTATIGYFTQNRSDLGSNNINYEFMYNSDNEFIASVVVLNMRDYFQNYDGSRSPLVLGIGVKFLIGDDVLINNKKTIGGIALGGAIGYEFPTQLPIRMVLSAYISPEIFSFRDAKNITSYKLEGSVEILSSTYAIFGYKNTSYTYEEGEEDDIDKTTTHSSDLSPSFFIGIKLDL